REDAREFLDSHKVRSVVQQYSDHVAFPIQMPSEAQAGEDGEDGEPGAEGQGESQWQTTNSATALWQRPRSEVSDEEYQNFYRHISHDFQDALTWSHNKVEGALEYTSLLYVPARAPFDLYQREASRGLKLYVQRV